MAVSLVWVLLCLVALQLATYVKAASPLSMALEPAFLDPSISSKCVQDLKTLNDDEDFHQAMKDIARNLASFSTDGNTESKCADSGECTSPFANTTFHVRAYCCHFDGYEYWYVESSHEDRRKLLTTLTQAGDKILPGRLQFLNKFINEHWEFSYNTFEAWTSIDYSFWQPLYLPNSCKNYQDAQGIAFSFSRACMKANNNFYATTKLCNYSF